MITPAGSPYNYNGTESFSILVNDLINPGGRIFSYYDRNYNGASTSVYLPEPVVIGDIRLVKVEFLIDANSSKAPVPLYLSSQVMIRNLKDNL